MADIRTARLRLHAVDLAEAQRIAQRTPGPTDTWAEDYPFDGDVIGASAFVNAAAAHGEQRPFGHYLVARLSDGRAIGGIGFLGQPQHGCVELGYGLAPSGRGHGYAAEAAAALLALAAGHGVTRVIADTTPDNVASQRTLVRAGFRLVRADGDLLYYEAFPVAGVG